MSKTKTIALFRDDALNKQANDIIKRIKKLSKIIDKTGRKTDAEQNTLSRTKAGVEMMNQQLIQIVSENRDKLVNNIKTF